MIAKISALFKSTFLENINWHTSFVENKTLNKENLEKFLQDNLVAVIDSFIESILLGEYEREVNFEELLSNLQKESSSIYGNLVSELNEDITLLNSTEEFVRGLQVLISGYTNFCKEISIHKTFPNYDVLFTSMPDNSALIDELTFDDDITASFINFFRTLFVNRFDHFFDEGMEFLKNLIELENSINKSKHPFKHISALKLKISFLKYKWAVRQNTTYQSIDDGQFSVKSYLLNDNLISVLEPPEFITTHEKLNEWKKYLDFHYNYSEKDYHFKRYNDLKLRELKDLNFFELHFLIKFYKDIKKDYKNLSDVIEVIEKKEADCALNKSHYFKNLNYALNNQFSLLIENESVKEEDVIELREKIKKLQNKSGSDNFFLEYKYLSFCIERLKRLIKKREAFDTEISVNKYLKEIRELISECEKKISWSQNHHNLLYQLPYDESLVGYNSESLESIYFASSFLLPLSIEQANYDIQKIKINFNNEFSYIEVYNTLDKEFNQIKDIKASVTQYEKKSIETISIYTAIISFIVGSVSGFSFIDSFYKAIIFLLIFSTSLTSFLLLVFISTKGFDKIYKFKKALLYFYFGIATLLGVVFYFKDQNDKLEAIQKKLTIEKYINKYLDSISTIKNLDSLKIKYESKELKTNHIYNKQKK